MQNSYRFIDKQFGIKSDLMIKLTVNINFESEEIGFVADSKPIIRMENIFSVEKKLSERLLKKPEPFPDT